MDKTELNNCTKQILANLEDSKARDIVTIDLDDHNDICNHMIITSGTSNRHVKSIADKLIYSLKHDEDIKISSYNVEGYNEGTWVVIDAFFIVVHIFQPELRELYKLEELWGNTKSFPI